MDHLEEKIEDFEIDSTLEEWRKRGSQIAFIFDYVIEKYQGLTNRYTLLALIFSALASAGSLTNLGLAEAAYPELALGLRIFGVATSVLTTCFAGVIKIMGWSDLTKSSQKYLDSVENFTGSIVSELSLPSKFRSDPEKFILQNKDKFDAILKSAPDIPQSDYLKAMEEYEKSEKRFRQDLILV